MDNFPKKPCRFCKGLNHFPYACFKNPKNLEKSRKKISLNTKHHKAWMKARATWKRKNPAPVQEKYWECYLRISPLCIKLIDESQLTLDHFISRSSDPAKRLDLSNLRPACGYCNVLKGSRSVEVIEREYGVKLK